jgi:hypothetical protein
MRANFYKKIKEKKQALIDGTKNQLMLAARKAD